MEDPPSMNALKTMVVIPLNRGNYSTWKALVLMKEGLWGLINGTETEPWA